MTGIFIVIIVLAYLDTDDWTHTFMVLNLVLAVIINFFRALFRVTNKLELLFFTCIMHDVAPCQLSSSYLGRFPVTYISSLSNGICMGGLIAVSINIAILGMDVDMQVSKKKTEC